MNGASNGTRPLTYVLASILAGIAIWFFTSFFNMRSDIAAVRASQDAEEARLQNIEGRLNTMADNLIRRDVSK